MLTFGIKQMSAEFIKPMKYKSNKHKRQIIWWDESRRFFKLPDPNN
jgi:hypothetical protein